MLLLLGAAASLAYSFREDSWVHVEQYLVGASLGPPAPQQQLPQLSGFPFEGECPAVFAAALVFLAQLAAGGAVHRPAAVFGPRVLLLVSRARCGAKLLQG